MTFMVDNMARRYGMLPTQILNQATTHDIQIYLHAVTYEERQRAEKAQVGDTYTATELQEIYQSWRGSSD